MNKKILLVLVCTFLFGSCQFFEQKVPSEKALFEKRLMEINWQRVDKYPSIAACEAIKDETAKRNCFFSFLTQTIQEKISFDTLSKMYPNSDTIAVKVTVFPNATIKFEPQFSKDSTNYEKNKIDSILHVRLVGFPRITPAIKHGIPVKTQFVVPIILKKVK